jgi:hypothetical protein
MRKFNANIQGLQGLAGAKTPKGFSNIVKAKT